MRYLEDIKNKEGHPPHEGQEIWIVGLGPSLDDFPDNFFEDKISIGLNYCFVAFPHLTYFLSGDRGIGASSTLMIQTNPELVKRTIWILQFERGKYMNHPRIPAPAGNGFGKYKDDTIYITKRLETKGQIEVFKKALPATIGDIIQKKKICHFIALNTIAHYGIQCAAVLGAKKITLVGCEARTTKHSFHAQKRGLHNVHAKMSPSLKKDGTPGRTYSIEYQTGKIPCLTHFRIGAELLAKELAPYRIEVRRYYYKSGYEALV